MNGFEMMGANNIKKKVMLFFSIKRAFDLTKGSSFQKV